MLIKQLDIQAIRKGESANAVDDSCDSFDSLVARIYGVACGQHHTSAARNRVDCVHRQSGVWQKNCVTAAFVRPRQ
jgi:hypothetical protein